MKIAVLGSGVIGTLYGWALSQKNEVVHIVRPEKVNSEQTWDLRMDLIDERLPEGEQDLAAKYHMQTVTEVDEYYDLMIVPVAEHQLEQALSDLTKKAPQGKYLLMASNWNGTEIIEKYLEKEQYILGYAGGGGTFRTVNGQKELWGNIGADIMLGTTDMHQKPLLGQADVLFREVDIIPEIPKDMLHWLWIHNIDSAAIGFGLKKYGDIIKFLKDEDLVRLCFAAMIEGFAVCEKRGVHLEDFPEVGMYAMPFEQIYPMFKENFETNPVMQRYTAHAVKAIPEMERDFMKIYETGKKLGMKLPNMDQLYQLGGSYGNRQVIS